MNFLSLKASFSFCCMYFQTAFSQGSFGGLDYVNFMMDEFSLLNITSLGRNLLEDQNECGFACLEILSCISYNVAAFPDINGKLLCELLPSDKYNNSDKFISSQYFHHFSFPVSRTANLYNKYRLFFTQHAAKFGFRTTKLQYKHFLMSDCQQPCIISANKIVMH